MNLFLPRYLNSIRLWCFLVLLGLMGCTSQPRVTGEPLDNRTQVPFNSETKPSETITAVARPGSTTTASPVSELISTITPTFAKTGIPILVTTIPTPSGDVLKGVVLLVSEDLGADFLRDSIWIMSPDESSPHALVQDQYLSFDQPSWSHNGEWIAYRQSDWQDKKAGFQLGVIHKDGSGKQVFTEKFGSLGLLNWSADDEMLIFSTILSPFGLYINTGEVVDLMPDSDNLKVVTSTAAGAMLKPSPKDAVAAYGEFTREPGTEVELWLLTLNGQNQENIELPAEITLPCKRELTTLEWSPDGGSILVQFGGWPPEECRPGLWLYKIAERLWREVARLPDGVPSNDFNETGWVNWSTDGRWVAWEARKYVLFFTVVDEKEWKMVRKFEFGGNDFSMVFPWVEDENGKALYVLNRNDYTAYPKVYTSIIGLEPGNVSSDERELVRIEGSSKWFPDNSFITPMIWEP